MTDRQTRMEFLQNHDGSSLSRVTFLTLRQKTCCDSLKTSYKDLACPHRVPSKYMQTFHLFMDRVGHRRAEFNVPLN